MAETRDARLASPGDLRRSRRRVLTTVRLDHDDAARRTLAVERRRRGSTHHFDRRDVFGIDVEVRTRNSARLQGRIVLELNDAVDDDHRLGVAAEARWGPKLNRQV